MLQAGCLRGVLELWARAAKNAPEKSWGKGNKTAGLHALLKDGINDRVSLRHNAE